MENNFTVKLLLFKDIVEFLKSDKMEGMLATLEHHDSYTTKRGLYVRKYKNENILVVAVDSVYEYLNNHIPGELIETKIIDITKPCISFIIDYKNKLIGFEDDVIVINDSVNNIQMSFNSYIKKEYKEFKIFFSGYEVIKDIFEKEYEEAILKEYKFYLKKYFESISEKRKELIKNKNYKALFTDEEILKCQCEKDKPFQLDKPNFLPFSYKLSYCSLKKAFNLRTNNEDRKKYIEKLVKGYGKETVGDILMTKIKNIRIQEVEKDIEIQMKNYFWDYRAINRALKAHDCKTVNVVVEKDIEIEYGRCYENKYLSCKAGEKIKCEPRIFYEFKTSYLKTLKGWKTIYLEEIKQIIYGKNVIWDKEEFKKKLEIALTME